MKILIVVLILGLIAGAFVLLGGVLLVTFLFARRPSADAATGAAAIPAPTNSVATLPPAVDSPSLVARLAQRFCPQCRAPLAADAPEGLCPACLLAAGLPAGLEVVDPAQAATTPPGHARHAPPPEAADLQRHFPQLEILELLGRGGMGAVYKARQKNLDRVVALKVIPPAAAQDPEFAERFAREARALARLNHANIVTVHDFGQADGVYFLLMEYIDGVNLRQALRAGRLAPDEALAIVPQICDALQYAHDQGVVHRDIKPENVLLDRAGRVKIADFGLAKLLSATASDFTLTRTEQIMGTPKYMAPEQLERVRSVDHRADIYSLGVVIYEMLTGELPIGRFDPPSHRVQVDVRVDEVVLRTLAKEPDRRYQRASEVKSGLAGVAMPAPVPRAAPRPPAKTIPLSPEEARRRVAAPGLALMVVGLLGLTPLVALLVIVPAFTNGPGHGDGYHLRAEAPSPRRTVVAHSAGAESDVRSLARAASVPPLARPAAVAPLLAQDHGAAMTATRLSGFAVLALILGLIDVVFSLLILVGGWQMRNLQTYGLAVTAAVIAFLPCTLFWLLGIPIGVWALVVLMQPDVRAAFAS